ncbi:hypothetical protein [Halomonas sp. NCCP-2165]|nr:hypothetical protein [Halomonas sp. NCCP-2165]GKW50888.1 hypothetical protein NCCP2165_31030 [Halomonas sp. NCCP-2165]
MPTPSPYRLPPLALRAFLYLLLVALLAQGAFWEASHLPEWRFTERGFTELAQGGLLLGASLLLLYTRQGLGLLPNVTLLLFAFTFGSFIREQDYWLDTHVFDGAWQLLAALVMLPSLYWVLRRRRRFAEEFADYANSLSFGLFAAGFLTTYVFSRLYGRSAFWEAILQEQYLRTFKDAAEEVVELLGYGLVLIAMIELVILARHWRRTRA